MDSVILLSVLLLVIMITNTKVLARPSDMGLKTKRSVDDQFTPKQIKFPTEMRDGFDLVINGSIDKDVKTFETTIKAASDKEEDHCKIVFHLENRTVVVTPVHSGEIGSIDLTPDEVLTGSDAFPMFSLKITAEKGFDIEPEYDGIKSTQILKCSKTNYNDFEHIEFSEGLRSISSLSFNFGDAIII